MDDRTVAQIAPSGDFGNTFAVNCDNPLLGAAQKAVICANENLLTTPDLMGVFPGTVTEARRDRLRRARRRSPARRPSPSSIR